jgi:ATP-dependent protease HslVU (ClpYQ) peptidase subunit
MPSCCCCCCFQDKLEADARAALIATAQQLRQLLEEMEAKAQQLKQQLEEVEANFACSWHRWAADDCQLARMASLMWVVVCQELRQH